MQEKSSNIEVVEVYPFEEKKSDNILEAGTCHISIKDLDIEVKNITYILYKDKRISIKGPSRIYKDHAKENGIFRVPSVSFNDKRIWFSIKNAIRKEVLNLL